MSGKLISEAAEAVILTLYSGKVIEGVKNEVPNPRLTQREADLGNWCGPRASTQTLYAGVDLGITGALV